MSQDTDQDKMIRRHISGMVRSKETGVMVPRKKAKPLKMIERDKEIIRLMHIIQDAQVVSEKMHVSKRRIYQIISEYRDASADELNKLPATSLAAVAKDRYEMLFNEAIKLAVEATKVQDPKDRIMAKSIAYDKAMKAQGQLDNLMKLLGIYKEHTVVEHIDITKTDEWIKMEDALRIFLRYFVGIDPSVFIDFVERVQSDSHYYDVIKAESEVREKNMGLMGSATSFDSSEFLPKKTILSMHDEEVVDVESEDVKVLGEDGMLYGDEESRRAGQDK